MGLEIEWVGERIELWERLQETRAERWVVSVYLIIREDKDAEDRVQVKSRMRGER
jgi:hypothetical protein